MSKTPPVRWWRDDADRYRPRGAYTAPREEPGPSWSFDLLTGPAPDLAACVALIRQMMIDFVTLPPCLGAGDPSFPSGWRRHLLR